METKLVSRKDLAGMLSLSTASVWRLTERGDFPQGITLNGAVRWVAAEVDAWVAAQPRRATRPSRYATVTDTRRKLPPISFLPTGK